MLILPSLNIYLSVYFSFNFFHTKIPKQNKKWVHAYTHTPHTTTKNPRSPFYVSQLLLGITPVLKCGWSPRTLSEITDFPFLSSDQWQIVSWLEAELGIHFPFLVLGFGVVWISVGLVNTAITLAVVLESSTTSGSYNLTSSSRRSPSLEGKGLTKTPHLGMCAPKPLPLLCGSLCGSVC